MRSWLLAAICFGTGPTIAGAQPRVIVRCESRIELRTSRADGFVVVDGTLRDDIGHGLSARRLFVRPLRTDGAAASARRVSTTDADGRFRLRLRLGSGVYRISAAFEGDRFHERVEVERRLDPDRADVRLRVDLPSGGRLNLDDASHTIVIVAESAAGGGALRIDLLDEFDRLLASGLSDDEGRLRLSITADALGPPGAGRIKARSEADAHRAEAQTEVPIVRYRATHLSLAAERGEVDAGEPMRLTGVLEDSSGPIAGRAVGLFSGDRHLTTVLTDSRGRFTGVVTPPVDDQETLTVVARFASDTPGRTSSASAPVTVQVAGAAAGAWSWLLLPSGLCGLLLLIMARRAPRHPERATRPPSLAPSGVLPGERRGRGAHRTDVGGTVLDHGDGNPLPSARVTLLHEDDAPMSIDIGPQGGFSSSGLAAGRWTIRAAADGYGTTESEIGIPHHGEWSRMSIRLESMRARAIAPYRRVAVAVLRTTRLWSIRTNREVLSQARVTGYPRQPMTELTERVEAASYARTPPDAEQIAEITRLARDVRETPGSSPGGDSVFAPHDRQARPPPEDARATEVDPPSDRDP